MADTTGTPAGSPDLIPGSPPADPSTSTDLTRTPDPFGFGTFDATGGTSPTSTTSTTPTSSTSSNPLDLGSWLQSALGLSGQNVSQLTSLLGYFNNQNNASQYMDLAGKYATEMNPFGPYRDAAAKQLQQYWANPQQFIQQSPGYQSAMTLMQQGLGRTDALKGWGNSGTMTADEMQQAGTIYGQQDSAIRTALENEAGVNIGPSAAAGLIGQGIQGAVSANNNAMTNLTRAMFPNTGPNGNTTNTTGIPTNLSSLLQAAGITDPNSMVKILQAAGYTNQQISAWINGTGQAPALANPQASAPYAPETGGVPTNTDSLNTYSPFVNSGGGYTDPWGGLSSTDPSLDPSSFWTTPGP